MVRKQNSLLMVIDYVGLSDGDEVTFNNTKYKVIYGEKDSGFYRFGLVHNPDYQCSCMAASKD